MTRTARFGKNYFMTDLQKAQDICEEVFKRTKVSISWLFEEGIEITYPKHFEAIDGGDYFQLLDGRQKYVVLEIYEGFDGLDIKVINEKLGLIKING